MQVTATNHTTALTGAQKRPQKPALSSDFETFLKMLTVQMRNQDPLNPVDSAEYAVQLATFSQVEQQAATNKLLEQVLDRIGAQDMSDMAGWIGKEIETAPQRSYGADGIILDLGERPAAGKTMVGVYGADGSLIMQKDMSHAEGVSLFRDEALPVGEYVFKKELKKPDGTVGASELLPGRGTVIETRRAKGGMEVVLASGEVVRPTNIRALRASAP